MAQPDRYDIVIFGASGYTGMYVVEALIKTIEKEKLQLTYAVAGRTLRKLYQSLEQIGSWVGKDLSQVPTIVADVTDERSVIEMTKQAKLVCNCAGPYIALGEVVVKACLETDTHHLDLSGEPQFLEGIQVKYYQEAKEKGLLIIGATGFDNIPTEAGLLFMRESLGKGSEISAVDTFLKFDPNIDRKAALLNHGTWDSLITAFGRIPELIRIRAEAKNTIFKGGFPTYQHKNSQRILPFRSKDVHQDDVQIAFDLGSISNSTGRRTELYNYCEFNQRPVQWASYVAIPNLFWALLTYLIIVFMAIFTQFKFARRLLRKYPHIFSLGFVSKDGPKRENVLKGTFTWYLIGYGWRRTFVTPNDEPDDPPTKLAIVKVSGPDPGYVATGLMMAQSAITVLEERDRIQVSGVLTPGVVFKDTNLVTRLKNNGMTFELVK